VVKSTVDNSQNSGSGSVTAVRQDATNSASADTVPASSASLAASSATTAAPLGSEDATEEMDEGQCCSPCWHPS